MRNRNILVTGKNGYVSKEVVSFFKSKQKNIESASIKNKEYLKIDFRKYDTVIHTAAIVHKRKVHYEEYYKVNVNLTRDIATLAKQSGVRHFIFFSSMSVFGVDQGVINSNTPLNPTNDYGKSKLDAEKVLGNMEDENFKITIIRAPMIYGFGCSGNYIKLSKISSKTFIFPNINNQRSMIHIENLNNFIFNIVEEEISGIFHPQNTKYVCTTDIYKKIRKSKKKKYILTSIFNMIIFKIMKKNNTVNKIFGDLVYDKKFSKVSFEYQTIDFDQSIYKSEGESCLE
ncbi:NAD-dependent epimerase/dehydratase family protein [Exiguobacterium sp. 9-2]|uniref:NAD-dependent epimerase/dehydratase family protein n=1 Tax=Exiguobacterium sp. 9-2 TaxID=3112419 RepID=UPI002E35828F|nr:NAD-dependent epimerase/dehydratase family protein [Exiguobacterium sp. 9-2]